MTLTEIQFQNISFSVKLLFIVICLLAGTTTQAQSSIEAPANMEMEEVVVTGTHIKGADITGALPVTVLSADDMENTGSLTGEDLLRSIPQLGSIGFGASRGGITGVNAARGDVASFNLRSLGEGNTLVLINGRRMVLHPITQTGNFSGVPITTANANTLPVAALQRVEVLRDGAGAIYGADAVGGVINYVLKDDYEGYEISLRTGTESGTDRADTTLKGAMGFQFNGGQTRLVMSSSYTTSDGVDANEYTFSSNQDLRSLAPQRFQRDTSLDQRSSLEPHAVVSFASLGSFRVRPKDLTGDDGSMYGVAQCGGRRVDANMAVIWQLPGASTVFNDGQQDLCLDQGGGHDRALRPNRNEERTLVPDIDRFNLFAHITHELSDDLELYGEMSYYSSTAERQWEQAAILSNGRFFVEADYYWNPFGPVTFDDGRANPNRLPGLDTAVVPEAGLGFELINLRPTDVQPRQIEVDSTSLRLLGGLTGSFHGGWDFDTAFLYSVANTEDKASNRISTPLFQAQINRDTMDAYNIFTGVNPNNPASIADSTPNPRSSIDPFIVSASRDVETNLTLLDFKLSHDSLVTLPAGDLGLALGVEWRKEELDEDNSSIFDGSVPFIDPLDTSLMANEITNPSSLQGSSVRPDVKADRKVLSVFAEAVVPIASGLPAIESLSMQLALRFEDFDDVGSILRPKVALSWYPIEQLQLRAAFSQGFRAPNLFQLNTPFASITTSVGDYAEGIHLKAQNPNNTDYAGYSINRGPANGNYILETAGNPELEPEESDNLNVGIVVTPLESLTFTFDWWKLEIDDTVGVFSDENEARMDAVLRASGSTNPNVIRAAPTTSDPLGEILRITRKYENLNRREIAGYDIGAFYTLESSVGTFDFKLNAARLTDFDQDPSPRQNQLIAFPASPTLVGAGTYIEREFFPEWRTTLAVSWNSTDDNWGLGMFASRVGKVFEPSVTAGSEFYYLDEYQTMNLIATHRGLMGSDSSIQLGINNVLDEEPPLAAEALGFEGELHSSRGRYIYLTVSKRFSE